MGRRPDDGKRDEWMQRFRRRETSGLTVATFCEWEGVSVAAFYRWQKKLRAGESGGRSTAGIALPAKSSPSLTKASFLPVRITQPGEARLASPCIEIRPPNGVRIFVPNSYENIIQRTLKTAHSLPPISAAKRPPATEACFLLCKSFEACFLQTTCIH
ncbi:MAG: IS66 family insertion sequence element accessory protein TnpA [Planctomyces sp.]